MWHAAINGRGSFYAVEKGEDLKVAFREIIKTISTQVEPQKLLQPPAALTLPAMPSVDLLEITTLKMPGKARSVQN